MRRRPVPSVRRLLPSSSILILLTAGACPASAQSTAAVIIAGLSPDAVGHFDADQCRGCSPERDQTGLCNNSCVSGCRDAARTTFTGDGTTGSCAQFDGDATGCAGAWQLANGVPTSCFLSGASCVGCGSFDQENNLCVNSCYPCADANRTTFAGGSFLPDACRDFDNDQAACAAAWVLNGFSNVPLACFFDGSSNECHACEVGERLAGLCTNTCAVCEDPTFTSFASEANGSGSGCATLAGDEAACTTSWQYETGHVPTACFFTPGSELNQGGFLFIQDGFDRLGPLVTNGKTLAVCLGCNGTTASEGFDKGFDESTLPALGWTRTSLTDPTEIGQFFTGGGPTAIADAGLVYLPSQEDDTPHQGISAEQVAVIDANKAALGAFVSSGGGLFALNESQLEGGFDWLDAIVPGAQARTGFTCLQDLALTPPGVPTFPHVDAPLLQTFDDHTSGYFLGTFGDLAVLTEDHCRDVTCKDAAKTNLLGRTQQFFNDLCQLEPDETTCDESWQLSGPAVSCAFENGGCRRCGEAFEGNPLCPNTCLACDDPTHTTFAGEQNTPNCEGISDPAACATAWAVGREGLDVSCFFDVLANFCRACETEDEINGDCTNTCEPPPGVRAAVLGPALAGSPTPVGTTIETPTATATPTASASDTATPSALATPAATATAGPVGTLPSFQCYAIKREPVAPIRDVQIADVFGSGASALRRPKRLCAPADVNGTAPTAPADERHLLGYELQDRAPRFLKQKHVGVADQFGALDVDLVRPVLLMTPTRKSLQGDPGAPDGIGLDPFACYHVVGAKRREAGLTVTDQFGALALDIKRPFRICVAASKNGEPVGAPDAALVCYRVRPERAPRFPGADPVFVHDQFGPREITVKRPTELCVPATVGVRPED